MRIIDADALKKDFSLNFGGVSHAVAAAEIIDRQPTVEAILHTREQVDGWPGCSYCQDGVYSGAAYDMTCRGEEADFCKFCGRPLTDKAVRITLQRLEALKDGTAD